MRKKKKRERARNKSTQEEVERLFENDSEVLNHNYENVEPDVEPDVVSTDDAVNENIEEPFVQETEASLNNTLPGNSTDRFSSFNDILDDINTDLNNISNSDLLTSTMLPRRFSQRQASKRAQLHACSQVSPEREEPSSPPPTPATMSS